MVTTVAARPQVVSLRDAYPLWAARNVRGTCLPDGLKSQALLELDAAFGIPVRVRKREFLYLSLIHI